MDLLKRELAPITPDAWEMVEQEARRVLNLNLAGRKVVDFAGPHGWTLGAVNTGRLDILKSHPVPGVSVGLRTVQRLVEMRVPFRLDIMELDTVPRGASAIELEAVVEAAERTARVEDRAIFHGYKEGGITGIIEASPHKPLTIPTPEKYPNVIVEAREVLEEAGIDGPFALVLSSRCYKEISQATEDGYPIRKRIDRQIIDGPVVRAPSIEGAVLMSTRGGDFELTVGQDVSIGYVSHDREKVELYLTESFTFRILEPAAAIYLQPAGKAK